MPSGAAVASPHLSCFVTSHVVHRLCRLYCAQASFQNAAPASLFTEIWYKFYDSRTGRHTKKPPAQNKKCHKVKLYNLCQNKVERFMPAVVADNQDEGKLIFLLVLQSYNGPCHPPARSFTGYKLHDLYLCINREIIRWERNTFQAIRSQFPSKHNKTPHIYFSFIPYVTMGTNPSRTGNV